MPHRKALTLVELLVVIGIIGMFLALLLPAVHKARGIANRIKCGNNLKQIGLSLHLHHQDYKRFPPGISSGNTVEDPYLRMTWLTRLLPYVERHDLWRTALAAYDFQPSPFVNPPHVGLSTPVRLFTCPEDPRTFTAQLTHRRRYVAVTSYVGVLGTAYDRPDGVLLLDSRTRLEDINDGTSNTLMVGERPPSTDFWYGWWYAGFGQAGTGSIDMLLGARERNLGGAFVESCPPGPYHFQPGRQDQQCDVFHFWSQHNSGAHFLFGDGSVRFLNYSADRVLPALATRHGSEVVTHPDI